MASKISIIPLSEKDESQRANWETLKPEIRRLYIDEKRSLEETRAEIYTISGFQASFKSYKNKLREWSFKKNIPGSLMQSIVSKEEECARQGEDTIFRYGGTEITQERIQNWKSRRSHVVAFLPDAETHPVITYTTPSVGGCSSSPEENQTSKTDLPQFPHIKLIDEWLFDEHRPWSLYDSRTNRLNHHDQTAANDEIIFEEVKEIEMAFDDHNDVAELCGTGKQPFRSSSPIGETEAQHRASEDSALMDVVALQGKLVKCLRYYEEHSPQALFIRFRLAKALNEIGAQKEAESHCRRILDKSSEICVQICLGLILAQTDRLEESAKCLFGALTGFIINFGIYSLEENKRLFEMIYDLFVISIQRDWVSLTNCMTEMMATLRKPKSDADIPQICPQLFIHGFSFAQKCNLIGLTDSAKTLYEYLLEHSCTHFVNNSYVFEKAIAHQKYGLLLRTERNWTSSAQQLLLACKSAMKSGSYDRRLVVLLANNFDDLRPQLSAVPNEADTLAKNIELMLARMRYQNHTSKLDHVAHFEKYFESGLPIHFATFEPSAISHQVAHWTLPSRTTEISRDEEDQASAVGTNRVMIRSLRKSAIKSEVKSLSTSLSENTGGDGSHPYGMITMSDDELF